MRHKHNLSHYKLLTGDMGKLYPVGLVEVLPKDTFQHSLSLFMRFSPMAAPVMHPVTVRIHHMYVPHRIIWPESEGGGWENFITGGENNDDSQVPPQISTTGVEGDLLDYFNLPTKPGISVSALPVRAFNLVFNEYYRDQDLVPKREDIDTSIPLVAWEKDYLTTARPFSQKGPAITLPIGARAPVIGIGKKDQTFTLSNDQVFETGANASREYVSNESTGITSGGHFGIEEDPDNPGFPGIYADLSAAEAIDINDFRRAFALQRFAEARAKYGSRYTEYLRYLGVRSSDARLQRPEYLGGGKVKVSISEVLQTTHDVGGAETERFGVGDMFGHGVAHMRSNAYRRTFEEHGYVLSFLSVRPKAMYLNGITRTWLRQDREQFWQRELEQIGQQEIFNAEVYADGTPADLETFGFSDRYQEYKREPNRVSSEFKTSLNYWHLGRDFESLPVLNQSFVECDASKRIFNVQDQHTLWIAAQHSLVARRLVRTGSSSRIL